VRSAEKQDVNLSRAEAEDACGVHRFGWNDRLRLLGATVCGLPFEIRFRKRMRNERHAFRKCRIASCVIAMFRSDHNVFDRLRSDGRDV
jgi:hypothetical protein